MPGTPLCPKLVAKIRKLFSREEAAAAERLLETDCGDELPLIASQGADGIERVRCAALKLSEGSLEKLSRSIGIAKRDWRDVLVAAGFANDIHRHLSWLESDDDLRG